MNSLPGIDHPLMLVRDIQAARAFYARLGFTLTPVGLHPWGTNTSLAVLERSALELMSIYDEMLLDGLAAGPFRFGRHMRDALAEREGISLIALHSADMGHASPVTTARYAKASKDAAGASAEQVARLVQDRLAQRPIERGTVVPIAGRKPR